MESWGCCPVLEDGKTAGNGAALDERGGLWVTASGRAAGVPPRLMLVEGFDPGSWTAEVWGDAGLEPTSDTPLHDVALRALEGAGAALHGHVLETERAAAALGLPLSGEETEFSTAEDREALVALLRSAPYPAHDAWVRRGHGFFVVGPDVPAALARVRALALEARRLGLLPAP
jgi:ribulose-5-phosphate 4-epimerase/fuculose-1-phosphate aldolase